MMRRSWNSSRAGQALGFQKAESILWQLAEGRLHSCQGALLGKVWYLQEGPEVQPYCEISLYSDLKKNLGWVSMWYSGSDTRWFGVSGLQSRLSHSSGRLKHTLEIAPMVQNAVLSALGDLCKVPDFWSQAGPATAVRSIYKMYALTILSTFQLIKNE